ncbi:MAG: DUF3987 domain-containing protein [Bifidobacteriaceae bacterium]|jgi:hypothetical protein|nr:DUF3987 domain-containing protein [Bifidobacteriaceae bacterium]
MSTKDAYELLFEDLYVKQQIQILRFDNDELGLALHENSILEKVKSGQLSLYGGKISFGWGVKTSSPITSDDLVQFDYVLDLNGYFLYLRVEKNKLHDNQKKCDLWAKRYCSTPINLERAVYFSGVEKVNYKLEEEPINENSPVKFLSKKEQKYLRENRKSNLIYEYYSFMKYILSDADHKYIKTSFFMLLSSLLADKAKFQFHFGFIYPNLYCMILGASSSRKSSTYNRMVTILERIRPEVIENSLASSEGLQELLKQANGRSTLAFIDEFQEYFRENSAKKYKAGFSAELNKAYEEKYTLNATKLDIKTGTNDIKRVDSRFSLYVTGVGSKLADSINDSVLGTGFIERFLIVYLDDEVKLEVKRNNIMKSKEENAVVRNQYITNIKTLTELITNRYVAIMDSNEEIGATDDARQKINDVEYSLDLFANDNNKTSSIDKFKASVIKCCILLGRYKNESEISLETVLEVLEVAQFWFDSMLMFYNRLQKTGFQIKTDKIYNYLKTHRQVKLQELNREFNYFIDERGINPVPVIVSNLESQGKVKQFPKYKNGVKVDYVEAVIFEEEIEKDKINNR